jgi:hypothetical protein
MAHRLRREYVGDVWTSLFVVVLVVRVDAELGQTRE